METKDYLDKDVYSVVEDDGRKRIKMEYYYYRNENGIQCVEFTFCYVDIPATTEKAEEAESECTQYQCNVGDEDFKNDVVEILSKLEHLPIESVTTDTPCGTYLDF